MTSYILIYKTTTVMTSESYKYFFCVISFKINSTVIIRYISIEHIIMLKQKSLRIKQS